MRRALPICILYIYTVYHICLKSWSLAAKEECGCIPFGCIMSLPADTDTVGPSSSWQVERAKKKLQERRDEDTPSSYFCRNNLIQYVESDQMTSNQTYIFKRGLLFPVADPLSQGGTSQTRSKHWPLALRTSARQRWKREPYWNTLAGAEVSMFAASSSLQ